jgi:hypothetical protein
MQQAAQSKRYAALLVAVAVAILPLGSVAEARPATAVVFRSAGAEAALLFTTDTLQCIIFVTRNGSVAAPETFLIYQILDRGTGFPTEEGSGLIPNSAFTASASSARLMVDTRTVPDFTYSTGTGGLLDISWTADGNFEISSIGITRIKTPASRLTIKGDRTLRTAIGQGTFFNSVVSGVYESSIGTNKETTITVDHPPT